MAEILKVSELEKIAGLDEDISMVEAAYAAASRSEETLSSTPTNDGLDATATEQNPSHLTGPHYQLVKSIVTELVDPPDPHFLRVGLVKARDPDDFRLRWVLEEDKERYERGELGLHEMVRGR